ncbi:MAG: hypothetical protein J6S97_07110 [Bacteroidales bacterium]|nr:hypothetical protein [Bacteroidales bacterium]MBP5521397.1 hypothetical protein [Bacteroidales bacterium]
MKKYFLLAAMAAVALVACKPANPDDEGDGPDDEKEYVQPIKIDGNFDDWSKLDASKVATAKCNPDAAKNALKIVKVYADEVYVFVYFEWDKEQTNPVPDVDHVPFHCYINGDGKADTGGYGDEFSDACSELMLEGFIYPDGTAVGSYEPGCHKWIGDTHGTGWTWEELGAVAGLCAGAGVPGKYEFYIARELYPLGKLADNFSIGFDIQLDWESVGVLPNAAVTDDNPGGLAPSLQITTVK